MILRRYARIGSEPRMEELDRDIAVGHEVGRDVNHAEAAGRDLLRDPVALVQRDADPRVERLDHRAIYVLFVRHHCSYVRTSEPFCKILFREAASDAARR